MRQILSNNQLLAEQINMFRDDFYDGVYHTIKATWQGRTAIVKSVSYSDSLSKRLVLDSWRRECAGQHHRGTTLPRWMPHRKRTGAYMSHVQRQIRKLFGPYYHQWVNFKVQVF